MSSGLEIRMTLDQVSRLTLEESITRGGPVPLSMIVVELPLNCISIALGEKNSSYVTIIF